MKENCESFHLVFLLVEPRGISPFLLSPEPQQRVRHLIGAQKIFVSTTKVPSLSSWMSCGHNGLNFYIVTSPLVTKSQVGAGIGDSKGNARNTGHVFQRWWLLSSHDILFSAFSVLCSVSVQWRPEEAIGNTTQTRSMPSEMSAGGEASLWGWVFYLFLFLCCAGGGREERSWTKGKGPTESTTGRVTAICCLLSLYGPSSFSCRMIADVLL